MHAGKSGESTPAATKGRRRLGHRLTLWSDRRAYVFAELTTPAAPARRLRGIFLMARPPLLSQEGNTLALPPSNTQRLLVREDIDRAGSLGRVVVLVAVDTF